MAKIELDEKGILAQIEKVNKAKRKLDDELCELESMMQKVSIKEQGDSEESPKG